MEGAILPRAPFQERVNVSSGRSRSMVHRRDRISVRNPKEGVRRLPSEWFYIEDVPLPDPVRIGLPEFDNAPLKKRLSWRPGSPQRESDRDIVYLMGRMRLLAHSGLTMIGVMAECIMRGVQPLQYRSHPMWDFNGEDDATRYGRKGPDSVTALLKILSTLYKGEEEEFLRVNPQGGLSMHNPPSWVSGHIYLLICLVFPLLNT